MKKHTRLLLASAALLLTTLTSHCLAASQVVIPIPAGTVIASGSTIFVSGTTALDKAPVYFYSISGTVGGTGQFLSLTGTGGVDLALVLDAVHSPLVSYLSANILDLTSKFPFTAVNKLAKGSIVISGTSAFKGFTLTGAIRAKAGISSTGIPYGELANVLFSIKIPGLGSLPITKGEGSFVFKSGQVVIQTGPITTGSFQPDLSFSTPTGLVGVGITGTANVAGETAPLTLLPRGVGKTVVGVLQNSGTTPDTFTLSATPPPAGFAEVFIIGRANEAAAVTGTTGGFITSTVLSAGSVETFTWRIINRRAATNNTFSPVLTATSVGDPTKQDAIGLQVKAR